jgi:hypothetical protein
MKVHGYVAQQAESPLSQFHQVRGLDSFSTFLPCALILDYMIIILFQILCYIDASNNICY